MHVNRVPRCCRGIMSKFFFLFFFWFKITIRHIDHSLFKNESIN